MIYFSHLWAIALFLISGITITLNTEQLLNAGLGNNFDVSQPVLIGALYLHMCDIFLEKLALDNSVVHQPARKKVWVLLISCEI